MLYNAVGRHDGKPAAVIAVFQIPGTNALDVANSIKATMDDLSTRFPRDMDYLVSLDTTLPVTEGINEIVHTLFEAVALVIIVVFIFLQNWRATLIPLMTVPVSLVGAFIFFPMLGFSINVLSLLGLVLAIGIVVDDAIVVVEAVMHHIEHGMPPKEATIKAMEEVSGPVIAIGLILMRGVRAGRLHGRHHRPAVSAVRDHDRAVGAAVGDQRADAQPGAGGAAAEGADRQEDAADAVLQRVQQGVRLDHRRLRQLRGDPDPQDVPQPGVHRRADARDRRAGAAASPAASCRKRTRAIILVNALLPDAASLERTDAVMKKAEAILEKNEAIEGFNTITGYSACSPAPTRRTWASSSCS